MAEPPHGRTRGTATAAASPEMDKREQRAALVRLLVVVVGGLVVAALFGALGLCSSCWR